MYTESRVVSLEGAIGVLDHRTRELGRLETRLANVERLGEAAADVSALLALLTDPTAAKKQLAELVKATQELEAGKAQLAADREAHERETAETKAQLASRWALLMERERAAPPPAPKPEPVDNFPFHPDFPPAAERIPG